MTEIETQEPRAGEDEAVVGVFLPISFRGCGRRGVKLAQSRTDVPADVGEGEVRIRAAYHSRAADAAGAHDGAGGQVRECHRPTFPSLPHHHHVPRRASWSYGIDFASVRQFGRHVFQAVHDAVDFPVEEQGFQLFGPEAFAGLGEGVQWGVLDMVACCCGGVDLRREVRGKQSGEEGGLGEGEGGGAGANVEGSGLCCGFGCGWAVSGVGGGR